MTNKTLAQQFKRYNPRPEFVGLMNEGRIINILAEKERRLVEVSAFFESVHPKSKLYALEEDLRAAYDLRSIRILPRYPSELFCYDYIREILIETERIGAVSRGFFDNAKYTLNRSRVAGGEEQVELDIEIPFSDGCIGLLYDARTPDIIATIIQSEFGLRTKVTIRRDEGYIPDYEEYSRSQLALLASQIVLEPPHPAEENGDTSQDAPPEPEEKLPSLNTEEAVVEAISDTAYKIGNLIFDVANPTYIFGPQFNIVTPTPLRNMRKPGRGIVVLGEVFECEVKKNRRGDRVTVSFSITDFDGSISAKWVIKAEEDDGKSESIAVGDVLAMKGSFKFDDFEGELVFAPSSIAKIVKIERSDNIEDIPAGIIPEGYPEDAPKKRVELHLHTQMSAMDAIIPPDKIVELAHKWGHRAVAITDHGGVQGFQKAMETAEKLGQKVIWGAEAYFVNDTARAVFGSANKPFSGEFIVFDIETTGLSSLKNHIIEIGAVKISGGEVKEVFGTYVNPGEHIPEEITALTGITDEMVKDAPSEAEAVRAFLEFAGGGILVAHNASFDIGFIRRVADKEGYPFPNTYVDTLAMSRYVNPELQKHRLDVLADYFGFGEFEHHRAHEDAAVLAKIFLAMADKLRKEGITDLAQMTAAMADKADPLVLPTYHIIILAKNRTGLKNLYKLISYGYLHCYRRHPRIPKSVLNLHREGLILGTACSEGELFTALLENKAEAEIEEIASFYDYFEIQPLCNNQYLIDSQRVKNRDELVALNKKIIELGEKYGKPVVATCDAHFIEKHDEIYRKILLSGMKFQDADREVGLYFRTTAEMLAEFDYLPPEKAWEVVVTNPNKIADMVEDDIRPFPKGTFTPQMEGAEEELQNLCYSRAKAIYGDPLPEAVSKRLDRELTSIIKNGFAVLYIIAQKLVAFSESQGYLVGSRGSVGSSAVAFFAGISEVNPLPPHYVCPNCKYSDFSNEANAGSGFDLPDKNCPVCGTKLYGDGHDIPFETFLGFYGEKSPDIDLNFSGEIQAKVHKYTEELFGAENVFRAGTIGALASKTAYGFVMKYIEGKGLKVSKAEVNRLVSRCVGVKRTTGQHPGGIVVVPRDMEIYDFTPVQHPADDPGSGVITTHFTFEYLHDTLLKLDELGHDVPTKYKWMEKFTGIPVTSVPMNDPKVYELFLSTKPLGIKPDDIGGIKLGTLGLPEMGTSFVLPVLEEAKPKSFADLMQIMGLTHGTDVWSGNAQELIRSGICTISEVIGTRDGIMLTLMKYGLDPSDAFKIMEFVRKNKKGQPLKPEMVEAMKAHNVPDWYIESLGKIKYMFPKAHAAAYAMSSIRLGWYKVYRPLEFYAAMFTVAPGGFEAQLVMRGKREVERVLEELSSKKNGELSQKEAAMVTTLQLVNEFYARGFEFLPVDLKKSDAFVFKPEDGKIRLPFSSLAGIGETAARNIAEVMAKEEIYSIEDLRIRAGLSKPVIDVLAENGVLDGLSETNQLSLF
ncbi:MAG TPA: PolC-type DNA polymerase III [Bacillota bacterium]|nr:PolC-type DNA polymerase III [Bacillota bacterium]